MFYIQFYFLIIGIVSICFSCTKYASLSDSGLTFYFLLSKDIKKIVIPWDSIVSVQIYSYNEKRVSGGGDFPTTHVMGKKAIKLSLALDNSVGNKMRLLKKINPINKVEIDNGENSIIMKRLPKGDVKDFLNKISVACR